MLAWMRLANLKEKTVDDVIEVVCFCFPNGDVFHAEATDSLDPKRAIDNWKAMHAEHAKDERLRGGFVHLLMRRDDYQRLPATNNSAAVFA